jgi:hypothetical protein
MTHEKRGAMVLLFAPFVKRKKTPGESPEARKAAYLNRRFMQIDADFCGATSMRFPESARICG